MKDLLVGVDVGGSKIAVLVATADGQVLARSEQVTPLGRPEVTLGAIAAAIHATVAQGGATLDRVAVVGLGIPGRVDPRAGVVRLAVNLQWEEVPAGSWLAGALEVPCFLENDVRAAAVGVQHHPDYRGTRHLLYLSVGTGIAAGLILDGRLYRGARGMAGEVGHMIMAPDGPRCGCGTRGCLEALAAGPALAHQAAQACRAGAVSALAGYPTLTAQAVFQAAAAGDALATGIVEQAGTVLARAIHQLVMAYDVERVVVGGGLARAGEGLLQPIARELDRIRQDSALARQMLPPDMVRGLPAAYEAGPWGAIILARTRLTSAQAAEAAGPEGGE